MSDVESTRAAVSIPQQRTEAVPDRVPDVVREFALVHAAMRQALDVLVQATTDLPTDSSRRARKLADYVSGLLVFIHHHHTGEDEHWWPSLVARSAAAGQVLAPLTDDHHELDPLLEALRGHVAHLQAGTHSPAALARDAAALRAHLLEHLAAEEPVLFPLLAAHLDEAEAARLGRLMAQSAPKRGLSYLLGAMDAAATEDEQAVILRKMPPPVRWLRPLLLRTYRRNVAVLTGA